MTLIGVKSKYGSCSGSCTGLINFKKKIKKKACVKDKQYIQIFTIIFNSGSNPDIGYSFSFLLLESE